MKSKQVRKTPEAEGGAISWRKWLSSSPAFVRERIYLGACLLCIVACAIYVSTSISARVMTRNAETTYYFGPTFPPGVVAGHDFWTTYTYSSILMRGMNIRNLPNDIPEKMRGYFTGDRNVSTYPPLIFMLYTPYLALAYDQAYAVQMLLLFLLNLGVIWMAARIFRTSLPEDSGKRENAWLVQYAVVAGLSFLAVSGYGYFFSVERGNCDILAMAFAWGFLWLLVEKPKQVWLQALLLSCAIHTKITPAVFVLLILWRHGWRCILPLCVCNVALLFVWGWGNALVFLDGLRRFSAAPDGWWGDHSAYSFAFTVLKPLTLRWEMWEKAIILFSASLVGVAWLVLRRRGFTGMNVMLAFALSVPLMLIAPSTSNDYKLVILYAPVAVFMLGWFWGYAYQGHRRYLFAMLAQLVILYYLSGSGGLSRSPLLMNKLPMILLTQCLMFITILFPRSVFQSFAEKPGIQGNGE